MLLHGDELGRTQRGNNNAYCHDSELTWVDWEPDAEGKEMLDFARRALALRRDHPVLRREGFFTGESAGRGDAPDVTWLAPDGGELTAEDWADPSRHALAVRFVDVESDLLLLLSCGPHAVGFRLPAGPPPGEWVELLATAREHRDRAVGGHLRLPAFSLALLAWRPR
jgi:glycogen operon protein